MTDALDALRDFQSRYCELYDDCDGGFGDGFCCLDCFCGRHNVCGRHGVCCLYGYSHPLHFGNRCQEGSDTN